MIASSPFCRRVSRTDEIMLQVAIGLVPGTVALIWYFGWGVLINMIIASAFALILEVAVSRLRGRPPLSAAGDLSALVTALLLAIAVPPTLPWWLTLAGVFFAIVIVKQLFGGLGYNAFNPAMAGYAFLLVSYPLAMTTWLPPDVPALLEARNLVTLSFMDSVRLIFLSELPAGLSWDAVSSATPLGEMRTELDRNRMIEEVRQSPLWGDFGGRGWEWVGNWFLVGGLYLLWRRVITWHIPVAMLLGMLVPSGMLWMVDPQAYPFPAFHLFSGGTILGAFFIATDPVTASTTKKGQLIFGAMAGFLVLVIRSWGGYPDAVAFAVLLMNIAVPTIDRYTQPRVFGHGKARG